ncbi:MAG TPA: hypothetical protein VGD43_23145, partial [Micromonospora sp.]
MSVQVAESPSRSAQAHGRRARSSAPARSRPARRSSAGIRAGQVIVTEVAVALLVAALGHGPLALAGAALTAVVLLAAAWLRLGRRWLYEWIRIGLRYAGRGHSLRPASEPAALLDLLVPG